MDKSLALAKVAAVALLYLHKLKGKYIAHSDLRKVRTPLHKLAVGHARSRSVSTGREVCPIVISYRACEVAVSPFSIGIPSGSLDIKSFENRSGEAAEIKCMEQLKRHMTEVLNVRNNI